MKPGALRIVPVAREFLELPSDSPLLLVLLPADEATSEAVARLRDRAGRGRLRAIS